MPVQSEKLTFYGANGDALDARLEKPDGDIHAVALFAHCFTCGKDIFAARRIARGLADSGIAVLRFDFTGLGASEGDFANTNFSSNVGDLVAAADHLRSHYQAPKILIGHSLGGAAVLAAASEISEVVAVATIGAPSEPAHVEHLLVDARDEIEAKGEARVELAGRSFRIQKQFLDDIAGSSLKEKIARLNRALLVFHGPQDAIVGIDQASKIFGAAKHPKSFVSLDDADHLLTSQADAIYVANVLAAWASRFIGASEAKPAGSETREGEVIVAETGEGKFTATVSAGRHTLRADEPKSVGGLDTGPAPYDFLLAALGTCTTMTLRMYADRKQLPLEKVTVRLRHQKVHAKDCAECETTVGRADLIDRTIEIVGDSLTDDQRSRLLEIADRCPVHRSLHDETVVRSKLG